MSNCSDHVWCGCDGLPISLRERDSASQFYLRPDIDLRRTTLAFTYFVADMDGAAIKIGTSAKPGARLYALRREMKRRLRLLGVIVGTRDDERRLHERFAHLRIEREWFHPEPELLRFIAREAVIYDGQPLMDGNWERSEERDGVIRVWDGPWWDRPRADPILLSESRPTTHGSGRVLWAKGREGYGAFCGSCHAEGLKFETFDAADRACSTHTATCKWAQVEQVWRAMSASEAVPHA